MYGLWSRFATLAYARRDIRPMQELNGGTMTSEGYLRRDNKVINKSSTVLNVPG